MEPDQSQQNNPEQQSNPLFNKMANKGRGMDGNDKAPGEETSTSTENVIWETQKGKKVDGDPSLESDQPAQQE